MLPVLWPLAFLIIISVLDYFSWLHANKKNKLFPREDRGPINYSPIYVMYFINTVFEIQFAFIILHVGRNLEMVNQVLERQFFGHKLNEYLKNNFQQGKEVLLIPKIESNGLYLY